MPRLYVFREMIIIYYSTWMLHSIFHVDPFESQRRFPVKKTRQQLQREKALLEQSRKLGLQDGSASLPPEQLLSTPKQRANSQKPPTSSPAVPSPLTLTSSTGDGELHGGESQLQEPGLENSHYGSRSAEIQTPKPDCKVEEKKMELLAREISLGSPPTRTTTNGREK